MVNLKVIIAFALAAMILAILAGGIGGVPFWEIIVRSIFAAVIFGGLGFAIGMIIDRFLPELSSSSGPVATDKAGKGSEIDEMIDSENPYEVFQGDFDGDFDGDLGAEDNDESLSAADIRNNRINLAEQRSTSDSGEALESSESNSSDLSDIEETAIAESDFHKNDASHEDNSGSGVNNRDDERPGQLMEDVATIDSMEIDDMPSLDNFDGTFSTFNSNSSDGGEIGSPSENKNSKMDVPEYLQDPGKSAQAIQTWLQRDKEG